MEFNGYLVGGFKHFLLFHMLGIIIPTYFHIFQRGRYTTTNHIYIYIYILYDLMISNGNGYKLLWMDIYIVHEYILHVLQLPYKWWRFSIVNILSHLDSFGRWSDPGCQFPCRHRAVAKAIRKARRWFVARKLAQDFIVILWDINGICMGY